MKHDHDNWVELDRLLSDLADEQLDDAGEERLAEILRSDEEARQHYLKYASMLGSLHWEYADAAAEPLPARDQPGRRQLGLLPGTPRRARVHPDRRREL